MELIYSETCGCSSPTTLTGRRELVNRSKLYSHMILTFHWQMAGLYSHMLRMEYMKNDLCMVNSDFADLVKLYCLTE